MPGKVRAWSLPDGSYMGVPPEVTLIHKVALVLENVALPKGALSPQHLTLTETKVFKSDNGQVIWDISIPNKGVLLINSSRTIAIVGFGSERVFDFGKVVIKPGKTSLDGWYIIAFTILEGESFQNPKRILLIAGVQVMNTGMKLERWDNMIGCKDWGQAPTIVEGVPAVIELKVGNRQVEVWALDNTGAHMKKIPVELKDGKAVFEIDPKWRTIWYEIIVKK